MHQESQTHPAVAKIPKKPTPYAVKKTKPGNPVLLELTYWVDFSLETPRLIYLIIISGFAFLKVTLPDLSSKLLRALSRAL